MEPPSMVEHVRGERGRIRPESNGAEDRANGLPGSSPIGPDVEAQMDDKSVPESDLACRIRAALRLLDTIDEPGTLVPADTAIEGTKNLLRAIQRECC